MPVLILVFTPKKVVKGLVKKLEFNSLAIICQRLCRSAHPLVGYTSSRGFNNPGSLLGGKAWELSAILTGPQRGSTTFSGAVAREASYH